MDTPVTTLEQAHELNPAFFPHTVYKNVTFGLGLGREFFPTTHGAYFATSTRRTRVEKRAYQVRFIDGATGKVVMVRDGFASMFGARGAARKLAESYQHGCQLCSDLGHNPANKCRD